ncbi:MAG: DUF3667 domain-containing protein [Candidatus Stygibacter australis]|nr:DUF3667 domain-containing protein [Candidatus Stygibacter australis]
MPEEKREIRHCPNCGEIVDNRFCPACGQENREYKATFKEMIKEFTAHTFNLDSRFLKTVKYLLFHPGWLTIEYFKGRRETYISPFRLYLIFSMIYFLTFTVQNFYSDISKGVKLVETGIQANEADSLEAMLAENAYKLTGDAKPGIEGTTELLDQNIQIDQEKFTSSFINSAPRIMFFLLPLAALILKLLYRRKILYFQHLIFLLHVHSFFFLTMFVFRMIPFEIVFVLFFLLSSVYLYIAQKKYYQQSVIKTLVKLSLFSTGYFIILAVLLLGNMMITLFSMV